MADERKDGGSRQEVYYDGSCPMCTAIVDSVERSDQGAAFTMRDITADPPPRGLTKEAVEKEMHVIGADGRVYRNADAILMLLDAYPKWRWLVRIGRLPGVHALLPLGYAFVAANRHFLFGPASRIYWVKVVAALGLLASLLLSSRLWAGERLYPLTPVLGLLPPVPSPFDWIVFGVLLFLVAGAAVSSRPRPFLLGAVAMLTSLFALDQQRLQPWAYQYAFTFLALGFFSWRFGDVEGRESAANTLRFVVASIYFWSGLQKLNAPFIGGVFPWMIGPIAKVFPVVAGLLYAFGAFVPFIEMAIGAALLTKRFRRLGILLAGAMCVLILSMLGPLGHGWNSVVWPWNIAELLFVVILFAGATVSAREILWVKGSHLHRLILIVFGFLPLLYFFNAWDSYPSWSLYSGTTNESAVYVSDRMKERLPVALASLVEEDGEGRQRIPVMNWAIAELNVPPYPETRIFKRVARGLCEDAEMPEDVYLSMRGRLSWFFADEPRLMDCGELLRR